MSNSGIVLTDTTNKLRSGNLAISEAWNLLILLNSRSRDLSVVMADLVGNLNHIPGILGLTNGLSLSTIARACPVRPSKTHTDLMKREHGMVDKANTI